MTSKAAIFALLSLWGVGAVATLPAAAQDTSTPATESSADSDDGDDLTDRVWVKAGDDQSLPGVIKIFLSDGTLVQDSCWETHRLGPWQLLSDTAVSWNEDGVDINAEIVSLTDVELVLSLRLGAVAIEETYVTTTVPYVCPDLPKA